MFSCVIFTFMWQNVPTRAGWVHEGTDRGTALQLKEFVKRWLNENKLYKKFLTLSDVLGSPTLVANLNANSVSANYSYVEISLCCNLTFLRFSV